MSYFNSPYWNLQYFNSAYWGTIPGITPPPQDDDTSILSTLPEKIDYSKIIKDDTEILEILTMVVEILSKK